MFLQKLVQGQNHLSSTGSSDDVLSMSGGSDSTSYSDFPSVQIPERVLHSISHCGKKITLTGFRCGQALYIYMSNKTLLNLSKQW